MVVDVNEAREVLDKFGKVSINFHNTNIQLITVHQAKELINIIYEQRQL